MKTRCVNFLLVESLLRFYMFYGNSLQIECPTGSGEYMHLGHVAEGVHSAREAAKLAKERGVEMPVTEAVTAVLEARLTPAAAVERLLARESKMER